MADVLTLTPGGHLFAGTWEELQLRAHAVCAACGMLVKDSGELLHRRPEGEGNTPEAELCTGWEPAVRFDALGMIVRGIVREAPDDQPNGPIECAIEEAHEAHLRMLDVVLPLTQASPEAHGALRAAGDSIADLTSLLADQARALQLASGPAVLPKGAIVARVSPPDAAPPRVTDEELAEVARLHAEATPEPWEETDPDEDGDETRIGPFYFTHEGKYDAWEADRAIVQRGRTLLPRLTAEVQDLRAERADASAVLTALGRPDDRKPLAQRIADARAETMAHLHIARGDLRTIADKLDEAGIGVRGPDDTIADRLDRLVADANRIEEERDQALDLVSRLAATWAGGGNPDDMRRLVAEAEALLGVQPEEQPTC